MARRAWLPNLHCQSRHHQRENQRNTENDGVTTHLPHGALLLVGPRTLGGRQLLRGFQLALLLRLAFGCLTCRLSLRRGQEVPLCSG